VKMQQITISPPNHKKTVSTLCLPLPYYLWKGVAYNQLHSVSFCEFLSVFIDSYLLGVIIILKMSIFYQKLLDIFGQSWSFSHQHESFWRWC
jgi:hypothetical protein